MQSPAAGRKTFEQATGHEKTGTLQDWIQFEPKENKSCVIEQKQRENEREDIRHPADREAVAIAETTAYSNVTK